MKNEGLMDRFPKLKELALRTWALVDAYHYAKANEKRKGLKDKYVLSENIMSPIIETRKLNKSEFKELALYQGNRIVYSGKSKCFYEAGTSKRIDSVYIDLQSARFGIGRGVYIDYKKTP
jgi:hypothetical protein